MLGASVLQSGSALACLPQHCRQPYSQLPSLASWARMLTSRPPLRAAATGAGSIAQEPAVTVDALSQGVPSFMTELQSRHTGRLKPNIMDKQRRVMLKNLTKGELTEWFEMQGARQLLLRSYALTSRAMQEHVQSGSANLSHTCMLAHKSVYTCSLSAHNNMGPSFARCSFRLFTPGERPQRAKHLWRWMYYKDHWVQDLEETHGKQYGFGADFRWSTKTWLFCKSSFRHHARTHICSAHLVQISLSSQQRHVICAGVRSLHAVLLLLPLCIGRGCHAPNAMYMTEIEALLAKHSEAGV